MCTTCGCDGGTTRIDGERLPGVAWRRVERGPLGAVHDHATSEARTIAVERDLLAANDLIAARNRAALAAAGVTALNLVSSPGSGKTTLLVRTIERLLARFPV